jgi:hypothetical protein
LGGSLTTLGYSASRKATIDVTDLIWKRAAIKSFSLFAQPPAAWEETWNTIVPQLQSGGIKPIVAKTVPLAEASDALRYLVEGCPGMSLSPVSVCYSNPRGEPVPMLFVHGQNHFTIRRSRLVCIVSN